MVVYNIGALKHFGPKKSDKKNCHIHIDFDLYYVFMYNFLCQTFLIFPIYIYILFTKRINTLWSGGISSMQVLAHFEPTIHKDF